jgi:hypothetical protein
MIMNWEVFGKKVQEPFTAFLMQNCEREQEASVAMIVLQAESPISYLQNTKQYQSAVNLVSNSRSSLL